MSRSRLLELLSHAHRTILLSSSPDSFLDCLPRGGRILPRRIPGVLSRSGEVGRRITCLEELATVRVFGVSVELSSTTELAFGNCGKCSEPETGSARVRIETVLTLLSQIESPELRWQQLRHLQ